MRFQNNFKLLMLVMVSWLLACSSPTIDYRENKQSGRQNATSEPVLDSDRGSLTNPDPDFDGEGEEPSILTVSCLESGSNDFTKPGTYGFKKGPSGSGPFIIAPEKMDPSCKHPVIVFGMGTYAPTSAYTGFYEHFASYGFVVVVDPTNNGQSSGDSMRTALDWAYDSELGDRLSDQAGATGHSQGGGGAYAMAGHPKIKAIVGLQPGQFAAANNTSAAYLGLAGTEDSFGQLTHPNLIHYPGTSGVDKFMASYIGANHISSMLNTADGPGLYYKATATAWFSCYLAGNQNACEMFESGTCAKLPPSSSNWTQCEGQL
jgi:hypothetical protein